MACTVVEEEKVTICVFFSEPSITVSPLFLGQSCVDANTIAKPQLMGLCLQHILDRKERKDTFFFFLTVSDEECISINRAV